MCGIFGSVGFKDISTKPLETLIHRGPDDFSEYVDMEKKLYLGHRRLSIIDLSKDGRQPMKLKDDNIYIIYNGEFYNYLNIKNEFFPNSEFQSKTDTEVILHLYKKFNYNTPKYMRGMFAFCIYDKNKNELFLCRDRCGIKPLYYYYKHGSFAFSSELSSLKIIPGIDLEIDPVGLDYYFTYGYIPAPFSAYKYIRKLEPAHYLIYDILNNNIKDIQCYWMLYENINKYRFNDEEEWIENIENKLRESISLHLISDVPVGVFLSGGLDSSMIVSKVAEVTTNPVKTYTIGFEKKEYDERSYADIVSKIFATDHLSEVVKPDAIAVLPKLIESFGEPFSDASAIPTYYVSQIARKYVKVILSGDGGDEIFAGYNHYKRMYRYNYLNSIPISIRNMIKHVGRFLPTQIPGYGLLQRQAYSNLELYHEMICIFSTEQKENLYQEEYKNILLNNKNTQFQKIIEENKCEKKGLITKLQIIDLNSYLPEDILTKVDRMSMLHSLETRVPLLDHELIELAFACPENIRFKEGNLKYIFKKILSKKLPKMIINRQKQGFGVPLNSWFKNELKILCSSLIEKMKDDPFLNYDYIQKLFHFHQKGGRDFSKYLYNVMIYKYWQDQE